MLVKCPECELQVSDKAVTCPHCGYPLQKNITNSSSGKAPAKRRSLPNGFGEISKIKNQNLRNPYRAMVTVGKTADGKPIRKMLKPKAYFPTYNEAYEALVEYNKNPYDLDSSTMTVKELYEKWSEEYFKTLNAASSIRTTTTAWAFCSSVYDMRVVDLRARHIKGCMEEGKCVINGVEHTTTAGIKCRIKTLFNIMLDYAVEYELIDKNYARTFAVSSSILKEKESLKTRHIPFTEEEMQILWDNVYEVPYVDAILIQCYSGWRPQELGHLLLENINLEEGTMVGGMKTEAGTNRLVPIHPRIRPFVERRYKEAVDLGCKYLINCTDDRVKDNDFELSYNRYWNRFIEVRDKLNLNPQHRPHDPRSHFITMAKKYNVDEYAIKYIVGHSITDVTEKVYTTREIDWLKTEIEKIK